MGSQIEIRMKTSEAFQDEMLKEYFKLKNQGTKVKRLMELLPKLKKDHDSNQEELEALLS